MMVGMWVDKMAVN
jgi:hypothetical protein